MVNVMVSACTPIIVGVADVTDFVSGDSYRALSPVELAAEAARLACEDAIGSLKHAPFIDTLIGIRTFEDSDPRMSSPFGKSNNYVRSVGNRIGIAPARAILSPAGGQAPQQMVSRACEDIAAGKSVCALLFGSEAISTARHLAKQGEAADWHEEVDGQTEDEGPQIGGIITMQGVLHGMVGAPETYALFETARRRRLGADRAEYALAMGRLFAPFTSVAANNPWAASRKPCSAEDLATVTAQNRMIAYPYPRLMVARDQVNQAAAVLIMSVGKARELEIAEERWVFLHGYADATELPILERPDLSQSQAAQFAVDLALQAARVEISELAWIDLYSCFPIAVFNIADAFGLAADDPRGLTVTGGLPFFGGPGNNYSTHAITEIVRRVRRDAGSYGLVGANGGFMSKYSAGVYSTRQVPFRQADHSAAISRLKSLQPTRKVDQPEGWASIESYTILYGRGSAPAGRVNSLGEAPPRGAIVIGRLEETGERFVCNPFETDIQTLEDLSQRDPLGRRIFVRSFPFGNRFCFSKAGLVRQAPYKSTTLRPHYEFILVERHDHVLEITINRPEVRNALHPPAALELEEIFDIFFADSGLWVAILTGAGDQAFCAGNDLKYGLSKPVFMPESGFGGLTSRKNRSKPVIAAVNGLALGGGTELCLASDLVVADECAMFGLTEVKIGLIAGAGGVQRLARQIPRKIATELIVTGRRIDAPEAKLLGLINRLAPAGGALAAARALAGEIVENSPLSVRLSLEMLRSSLKVADEDEAIWVPSALIDQVLFSEDALEGQLAFVQKRRPQWRNR